MKLIILALFIIISLSISSKPYSDLLNTLREDEVNKALLNLPKRQDENLLKTCLAMKDAKEKYSLTEAESAYLIYKWFSQNIEYICSETPDNNELAMTVYNNGKGSSKGIADLFKTICQLMNIESESISGNLRYIDYLSDYYIDIAIKIKDYNWNYIYINDEYYLIDIPNGSGGCAKTSYYRLYKDFYFATNPDIFIREHFPKESKWQFLTETITKEQFNSTIMLHNYFFESGFKTISQTINDDKETEFILTYDELSKTFEKDYSFVIYSNGKNDEIKSKSYNNADKEIKITYDLTDKDINILILGFNKGNSHESYVVAYYNINHS